MEEEVEEQFLDDIPEPIKDKVKDKVGDKVEDHVKKRFENMWRHVLNSKGLPFFRRRWHTDEEVDKYDKDAGFEGGARPKWNLIDWLKGKYR